MKNPGRLIGLVAATGIALCHNSPATAASVSAEAFLGGSIQLPPDDLPKFEEAFDTAALDAFTRQLPAPDASKLALSQGKDAPYEVGIITPVKYAVEDDGVFWSADDGRDVLTMTVTSPDAYGLRLRLEGTLPDGCELYIYAAGSNEQDRGPFALADLSGGWMPTVWGESATLVVAAESGKLPSPLDLRIAEVGQIVEDIGFFSDRQSVDCPDQHRDVSCYSDWSMQKNAVARILFPTSSGSLALCTGTLLADTDQNTQIPYFLTANHCISTQNSAGGAEFFWFYQTPNCNGTAPSVNTVPTTNGAALLDTDSGTDWTLLQLNSTPPQGAILAGWSTDDLQTGARVTGIHHPKGSYKRISFGTVVTPSADNGRSIRVDWTDGTTEGGSSGSALFDGQMRVVGDLSRGTNCLFGPVTDYYAKFRSYHSRISQYLGNGRTNAEELESGVLTRFYGISTRGYVGDDDSVMIAGFIIEGNESKQVIIRGIGPDMESDGVTNVLQNPLLQLFSGQTLLQQNNDWRQDPNAGAIEGSSFEPEFEVESAMVVNLQPGVYTAILRGANNTTGNGLIEVYEWPDESTSGPTFRGISTRGYVGTGTSVMIAGFIVSGNESRGIVVRGIGRELADAGVDPYLADPLLQIFSGSSLLLQNDNWGQDSSAGLLVGTEFEPVYPNESAIVRLFPPGVYTAVMSGVNNTTGNGLIEVYLWD